MSPSLIDALDAQLPQLQCGRCDYAGCRPYAQAIAEASAPLDRCVPGGAPTHLALSQVMGTTPTATLPPSEPPQYVEIVIDQCIGCHLCLPACPVDAIVGSLHQRHVVLTNACTGCGLCLPVCPVQCITIHPRAEESSAAIQDRAQKARIAFHQRQARMQRPALPPPLTRTIIRADIRAALHRAKTKTAQAPPDGHHDNH